MANHSTPLSQAHVGLQAHNRVQPAPFPSQRRSVRFKTSVDVVPPARSAISAAGIGSTDGKRRIPSCISPVSPVVRDPQSVIAALEARVNELGLEKARKQEVARLNSGETSKEKAGSATRSTSHSAMSQSVRAPPDFEVLVTRWKNNYQELKDRHEALLEREAAKGRENSDLERRNMTLSERVAQLELQLMWAKSSLHELTSAARSAEQVVKKLQARSRVASGRMG
ncbi:hypothetical protein K523DRAFT_18406 [Schizophyllum commune Tattone D]|nr:hypothetical protein K523DRAFT_18406 [Schizophyllum commune Tattone D]